MNGEIEHLDLILAGKLAMMIAAAEDIEINDGFMTVPIRTLDGPMASFDIDVRGLALEVQEIAPDALVAMGNDRGGQHAALALIANQIMEDHPDWDFSIDFDDDEDDSGGDSEPAVANIEDFGRRRSRSRHWRNFFAFLRDRGKRGN